MYDVMTAGPLAVPSGTVGRCGCTRVSGGWRLDVPEGHPAHALVVCTGCARDRGWRLRDYAPGGRH